MTLREQQSRFAFLVGKLILYAYEIGLELTLGDAYALAGHIRESFHYSRLAIDLNLFKEGAYLRDTEDHRPLGEYWLSLDPMCSWGGTFNRRDGNHYSYGESKCSS